jgi:hypothetical protein
MCHGHDGESSDGRFGRQFSFQDLEDYVITTYVRDAPPNG